MPLRGKTINIGGMSVAKGEVWGMKGEAAGESGSGRVDQRKKPPFVLW